VSRFDWPTTEPELALGFRFDIVVSGHLASPPEPAAS
jgi:hypothetical protein